MYFSEVEISHYEYMGESFITLKSVLEEQSLVLIKWFTNNFMKANPSKFQANCIGQKHLTVSSLLPLIMLRLNVKRVSLFLELT